MTRTAIAERLTELRAKEAELIRQMAPPHHIVEDITGEKLGVEMEANNEELFSASQDGRGACKTMLGKYVAGKQSDEDLYLKGFSGDSHAQDRIGRPGVSLNEPILSLAWAVQLDYFDRVFANKTLWDSGFLCRCLPCRIAANSSNPEYADDPELTKAMATYRARIGDILSEYHERKSPMLVVVDRAAFTALEEYDREIRRAIGKGELDSIRSFALRWAEIAWRIALIFHCAEHGKASHLCPLCEATAQHAIDVTHWFARHQADLFGKVMKSAQNDKLSVALAFVNRSGNAGIIADELYHKEQKLFEKVRDARAALDQLVAEESIICRKSGKSYRFYRKFLPKDR